MSHKNLTNQTFKSVAKKFHAPNVCPQTSHQPAIFRFLPSTLSRCDIKTRLSRFSPRDSTARLFSVHPNLSRANRNAAELSVTSRARRVRRLPPGAAWRIFPDNRAREPTRDDCLLRRCGDEEILRLTRAREPHRAIMDYIRRVRARWIVFLLRLCSS